MLTASPDGVPVLEPKQVVRRRFVMTLGIAAAVGLVAILAAGSGASDRIIGSGSTFAQPLIERLSVLYQDARSGDRDWVAGSTGVEYEPVGSLAGIMRLRDPEVDFAVADYPLSAAAAKQLGVSQAPIVIGSVSPAYNLGAAQARPLRFRAETLAGIFAGEITSWADPGIARDNAGLRLPDLRIVVVHRSDGSGTTLHWTRYLADGSASWRSRYGSATSLSWPTGIGVKGSAEMAAAVAARRGAIGYLETGQARRAGLAVGALQNPAGRFVLATPDTVRAGVPGLDLAAGSAAVAQGAAAYPVVSASYVFVKRANRSKKDAERTIRFLSFVLERGSREAAGLGYLPLSGEQAADARQALSRELAAN